MASTSETINAELKTIDTAILDATEVAENILENAFSYANSRILNLPNSPNSGTFLDRRDYFRVFRVGLENAVAEALIENDGGVESVFCFDPNANPDCETEEELPMDGSVNLIAVVDKPSAGLEAFANALDRALTERISKMPTPTYEKCASVMDLKLITQEDVKNRKGYAVLLTSAFSPASKIWPKK